MNKILILGNGQIGTAFNTLLDCVLGKSGTVRDIAISSSLRGNLCSEIVDVYSELGGDPSVDKLSELIKEKRASIVINALPFFLVEKVAKAAYNNECSYIDFTEDDDAAKKAYVIYKDKAHLSCAPKCGVAPGFINYVGNSLAKSIDKPETLMMSVGALPQTINYSSNSVDATYSLSWSVDGLVNEYLKPCNVRINGKNLKVPALTSLETVVLEGKMYEAAFTSGGAGTLLEDLSNVQNVFYKTLRYPGHFAYVKDAIKRHNSSFDKIKEEFLSIYPLDDQDCVTIYSYCVGRNAKKQLVKKSYHDTFYGAAGLSAIQTITAASALAILELIVQKKLSGCIRHNHIDISDFYNTAAYSFFFKNRR
jgi:saccharopine dehydrogenase-like NADP-dependent oxidoreductase